MCDYSQPSAIAFRERVARLPHGCISCGFTIVRGETYLYVSGIWDGEAQDFKRHLLCATLEEAASDDHGCGIPFGDLCNVDPADMSTTFSRAWHAVMQLIEAKP